MISSKNLSYMDELWPISVKQDYDVWVTVDGSEQERRNSSALAPELRLSCTNPLSL